MRKIVVLSSIFLFSLSFLSAQEEPVPSEEPAESVSFFSQIDKSLFFTAGPNLLLNTDSSTKSAPSPVMYSLGIGGDFSFVNGLLLQTHASFFTNYYLWDGENARPAEVENRTATALSFMLDLTGGYTFNLDEGKKHLLSVAGGLGFLFRHALLSNGVDADELNRETGSSAGDDVSDINGTFFSDLNFLYPEFAFSYSYILSETWKAGAEFRTYLPIGALANGHGVDGMIFSLAAKLNYR
ncbi:hypothetical protein [uncultured Treponema sp.]|uniref:hypothetical protein n=1 Tax=uncultured Treponema sp. TaxID=162155 RepID=UPI0026008445|nr:hypothetical protein [uncultured Treponema sp.]